jgi:hypothetical protein
VDPLARENCQGLEKAGLLFCSSRMGFKDDVVLIGAPQPYREVFVMRYDGTNVEQLAIISGKKADPLGSRSSQ